LGHYRETDDYIKPIANGVEEELKRHDFAVTLRQRDELLVKLIAAKKQASQIP
jgi:carnitine 3-dehydrogenase